MLSRVFPLTKILPLKTIPRFTVSRAHESRFCQPHMNELPVACLKWDEHYERTQSAYNKVLIAGIIWCIFSMFMMIATDSIRLNFFPPKVPAPPTEMLDDCSDE